MVTTSFSAAILILQNFAPYRGSLVIGLGAKRSLAATVLPVEFPNENCCFQRAILAES
ncbi:MAG: hypothetical protein VKL39_23590 [Leptolyngbyaceae bacterium]|nr:hypothetical protein [Leptolyngbyaceae bacterium]